MKCKNDNQKFFLYLHRLVRIDNLGNDVLTEIPLIFLKFNGRYYPTDFHKYTDKGGVKKQGFYNITSYYNVISFLNYVYFEKNYITTMNELTLDMVQDYLSYYGTRSEKKKSTTERCLNDVMNFLVNYEHKHKDFPIKENDMYVTKKVRSKNNQTVTVKTPKFKVTYAPSNQKIFRDMPHKAFEIIYANIFNNHKSILMAVALQAFAGLRPSEALNVRREDSPLGAGLLFESANGMVTSVSIDLNKEYNLRSDMVKVGSIKKKNAHSRYLQTSCRSF